MHALPVGQLIDGIYRIEDVISQTERAHVYAVRHERFPHVPLALKVVPLENTNDFQRDSHALASLTSPTLAHMCDRGTLSDGRAYRVVARLGGPSLAAAIHNSSFSDERVMELLVELSAAAYEAHANGLGPLDFSVENLMFADGLGSPLCMLRVLVLGSKEPDPNADEAALIALRAALEKGRTTDLSKTWKVPTSIAELKTATELAGGPHTPAASPPGARIGTWQIVHTLAETMTSAVYDVVSNVGLPAVLKIAGPSAEREQFVRDASILAKITHPNIVRVLDAGEHEGTPFVVMALQKGIRLSERVAKNGPVPVDLALELVEQMLAGAEEVAQVGGGPIDFSLEHCYVQEKPTRVVLTHTTAAKGRRFEFFAGSVADRRTMDPWSAGVALYELIAGRPPFPSSKKSLSRVWMGIPLPLASRRKDVPLAVSELVNELVSAGRARGVVPTHAALRELLTRLRRSATDPTPQRMSIAPQPQPAEWRLVAAPSRCPIAPLTAAAFRGDEIVAVSLDAVARYRRGKWMIEPAREIGPVGLRSLVPIGDRDYLAIGRNDRLYRLRDEGSFVPWGPVLAHYAWYGILPEGGGSDQAYLFGGSTDWGRGAVAKIDGERITIVADELGVRTLYAGASIDGVFVTVGAQGAIAVLDLRESGKTLIESATPCKSDLHVIAVAGSDILVAGNGAWAFRARRAPLTIEVESVDTTTSLTCIAVDEAGNAWLGSDRGRVLRRINQHWQRVSQPFTGDPPVLALHATTTRLRVVLGDGTIVLGEPAVR